MHTATVLSRPILRSIYCCAGAQWYSLRKLGHSLEAAHHKSKPAQVALAISRRAHHRLNSNIESFPLPEYLAEVELDIEIGFQHLTYAEHFLLLQQEGRAKHHSKKFIESLLAAARKAGKPIAQAEMQLIEFQCKTFNSRLRSQLELHQSIRNGSLSSRLTFVLGMHRSGTSALGGMLCQGGWDAPIDLMPPTEPNQKGFWESVGLYLINDIFFNELGTTWHSIDALPNGWEDLPQTKTWREDVLRHLKKVFYKASHPMIKDPRFCILMQGLAPWLESDLIKFCFLLPVRHPFEVAKSLEIAQNISIANGIRLWLNHVFSSELVSRGYPRLIVRFDKILSNPQEVLKCCKTVLESANIDFRLYDSLIIDKSLQHQRIESLRTDVERTTVMIETEREIASKLFDLLASADKGNPLDLTVVDDLYSLWQTLKGTSQN